MPFQKFINGFRKFRESYFAAGDVTYETLVRDGQTPEALVIACSDSRIDPAIVTNAAPGDLFVVRNVAALVPPCKVDDKHHGTSAAIEFAVKTLKVKHIIVMGHALCGGANALLHLEKSKAEYDFLSAWVSIGKTARQEVMEKLEKTTPVTQRKAIVHAIVLTSLRNLTTFPWITEGIQSGTLKLHGLYFDIRDGSLSAFNFQKNVFENILDEKAQKAAPATPALPAGCVCTDASIAALVDSYIKLKKSAA